MNQNNDLFEERGFLKIEFLKYFYYWPFYLISICFFLASSFLYYRYSNFTYISEAKIEVLDKAQDSEMALPTAMTIFNRSMINLDNSIGVLSSNSLHERVVNRLNSNVKLYTVGQIKTTLDHSSEFFNDYNLEYKIDLSSQIDKKMKFVLNINNNKLSVDFFNEDDEYIESTNFEGLTTKNKMHNLPFDLTINQFFDDDIKKSIVFSTVKSAIQEMQKKIEYVPVSETSDQIIINIKHTNIKIAEDYINTLISEFDNDGILDRRFEYKNTIEFVNERSVFLLAELKEIEDRKREYLVSNQLSNLTLDASLDSENMRVYDSQIFQYESQQGLVRVIKETMNDNIFKIIPANIGIDDDGLNQQILSHNELLVKRETYLKTLGKNNTIVLSIEGQLQESYDIISLSLDNYVDNLQLKLNDLKIKEKEFVNSYSKIPENEKILRSINRELEIKEALYLLLLQKKEEASINFAVIKPSVKVIDYAKTDLKSKNPTLTSIGIVSILLGFGIPTALVFILLSNNTKIQTPNELKNFLSSDIPVVGEIPFLNDKELKQNIQSNLSRSTLAESIRMVLSNLSFISSIDGQKNKSKNNCKIYLVTSSIKGEGKTIFSVNAANLLASGEKKVILIGADLRNPQIHKFLKIERTRLGLTDYLYKTDSKWEDFLIRNDNLDILLSGTIPPNPTEMISSLRLEELLNELKLKYDYVVIDSAPSLLVSDTFSLAKLADLTVYMIRSDFTEYNLMRYINENHKLGKLPNVSIVLNALGVKNSYNYAYNYSYKYGYNYGYGYGYATDNK